MDNNRKTFLPMKNLLVITLLFSSYSFSLFTTEGDWNFFSCRIDGLPSDALPTSPSRLLVNYYSMRFNLFDVVRWNTPYTKKEGLKSIYQAEQDVDGKKYEFSFYPMNFKLLMKVDGKEKKFSCELLN